MITLSVISSSSREAGTRHCSSSRATSSGSCTSIRSRVDRLTDTVSSRSASIHRRHSRTAVSTANMVSVRIRPLRSAMRDEAVGHDHAVLLVVPAHQRLGAGDAAGAQLQLGLVVQHQLAVCRPRRAARRPASGGRRRCRRRWARTPRSRCACPWPAYMATSARCISCSKVEQCSGHSTIPIEASTSSVSPCRANGCSSALMAARATLTAASTPSTSGSSMRELVAAQPGHRVAAPQHLAQARPHLAQQQVAGVVAERVVDLLEAVEVDQQQRGLLALAAGHDRLMRAVAQERAVGQAGERVVQRLVLRPGGRARAAPRRGLAAAARRWPRSERRSRTAPTGRPGAPCTGAGCRRRWPPPPGRPGTYTSNAPTGLEEPARRIGMYTSSRLPKWFRSFCVSRSVVSLVDAFSSSCADLCRAAPPPARRRAGRPGRARPATCRPSRRRAACGSRSGCGRCRRRRPRCP